MKKHQVRRVAVVLAIAACAPVSADEAIDLRVKKLEEAVQVLERRIVALEAQEPEKKVTAQAPPGKEGWRKLQSGMPEREVEALLGSPSKIDANAVFFIWYYKYPTGFVKFDTASRTVDGWNEP